MKLLLCVLALAGMCFAHKLALPFVLPDVIAQTVDGHWQLVNGHTLDELMKAIDDQRKETERCGQWGPWILDQNDNVMYRVKNPPCPKNPPKGPKNYSICDLMAIGKHHIPQEAMPRTLSNPSEPPPWTDQELKEFCGRAR